MLFAIWGVSDFFFFFIPSVQRKLSQAQIGQFSVYPSFTTPREYALITPFNLFLLPEIAQILWEASGHPTEVTSISISRPSPGT